MISTNNNSKPSVLIVNRLAGILHGGGETFDLNVCKILTQSGQRVKVLTGKKLLSSNASNFFNNIDVEYHRTPYLRGTGYSVSTINKKLAYALIALDSILFERTMFKRIQNLKRDYDIVHILALPRLAKLVVESLGMPVIVRFPGPPPVRSLNLIRHLGMNPAVRLIASGDSINYFRNNDIPVYNVSPGVDVERFCKRETSIRTRFNIENDAMLLLSVGRLIPGKGFEFLLQCVERCSKMNMPLRLMIVGEGPLKAQLVDLANRLGIASLIIFPGPVNHAQLPEFYSAADAFVLLSPYESFSIVTIEAASCSLPIIISDRFPAEITTKFGNLVVKYGDVSEFTNKFKKLVQEQAQSRLGKINRKTVVDFYSINAMRIKLETVYRSIYPSFQFTEMC